MKLTPKRIPAASKLNGKKAVAPPLLIDFPREGERVRPGHYAVRIAADGAQRVEVSINGGEWRACRSSVGYFWYDWRPEAPGRQELVARARFSKGRARKSDVRSCPIVAPSVN